MLKFPSNLPGNPGLINMGIVDQIVDNNYSKLDLTISTVDNTITMRRVANDSTVYNSVNILTVDVMATVGTVKTPGYVVHRYFFRMRFLPV